MDAMAGGSPCDGGDAQASRVDGDDIRHQLQRILDSPDFQRSGRLADFLTYVVEETLQGRQDRIKAYAIGIEVFGRDASFDPQVDPVVRIEAGRLRRDLEHYYLTIGRDDPVAVDIPKGGYIPRFSPRPGAGAAANGEAPAERDGRGSPGEPVPVMAPGRTGWQRWRLVAVAAVLAGLFTAVWIGTHPDASERAPWRASDNASQPGILLLPFAGLGGGQDIKAHAAAISDELKARLVRFREVTIVAPPTAEAEAAADSRNWPSARYVLDGSVRADRSQLRVTASLVDRRGGTVVWSDVYDIDLTATNIISLEQDIASRVATAVAQPYGVLFRSGEPARSKLPWTEASDAYQCSLDFYYYRAVLSAELHAKVRNCLQGSVAHAPNNATAWAMLSYTYLDEDRFGFNPIKEPTAISRALEAARRAVRLDPSNVRGLQALMTALFFAREPEESLRVGEQAYQLNPDDTELLGEFGSRLVQAGQRERGMAMMEASLARNPGASGYYSGMLALGAYLDGDDPRALVLIRRADLQHFPIYHLVAAMIFARNGLEEDAAVSRATFLRMRPNFFANFDAELDRRNFGPEDRAKLAADAVVAGFPVPDAEKYEAPEQRSELR